MKALHLNRLVFSAIVMFMAWVPCVLMAQEELEPLRGERHEQIEPVDLDSKTNSRIPANNNRESVRDSVVIRPAAQKKTDGKNENPQDDILSFNFLYYIIQRFKLSDIVD
ncbi:hypothetical protein QQ054_21165 [Oscillatoria amoena NRMC-F 0135]|nr:hypothetical protein [Oscillatoria amoena NRMC-F 0135]